MKTSFFLKKISLMMCYALFCITLLQAQLLEKRAAKIIDSGELLSTINFETNAQELAELKRQLPANVVSEVLANCTESSWVAGIATLDARNRNRPLIKDYVVYEVANVNGQHILLVPASENQGMIKEMRPNRDFYMVIGKTGVEVGDIVSKTAIADEEEVEDGLARVFIEDVGELYANFQLAEKETAKKIFIPQMGEESFKQLAHLSNESGWPSGINSFAQREKNREKIKDYHLYFISDIDDKSLVYAPEADNQHMPEDMRPLTEDGIFFIFKASAITLGYEEANDEVTNVAQNKYVAGDFESELNTLMLALKGDFASIKGDLIPKDTSSLAVSFSGDEFHSKISLSGSENIKVANGFLGTSTYVIAEFGEFRDADQAEKVYKKVVSQVHNMHFAVGTMVENEQNLENLHTTYWLPFDLGGKMDKAYQNIVLEVVNMKSKGFDKDFNLYDVYDVYLKIYKQGK